MPTFLATTAAVSLRASRRSRILRRRRSAASTPMLILLRVAFPSALPALPIYKLLSGLLHGLLYSPYACSFTGMGPYARLKRSALQKPLRSSGGLIVVWLVTPYYAVISK